MNDKPVLNKDLDENIFRSYYYLKEDLIKFCKENNLPTTGGKIEITERIAYFLKTGQILVNSSKRIKPEPVAPLTESSLIEPNLVCSEKHRAFFKEKIGKSFTFNVLFQKWLKDNAGKTYHEAIEAYRKILEEKKNNKTEIAKQFEYNTYIRDFFQDNPTKCLNDAITCWNYKKTQAGLHRYEPQDLAALEKV